MRSDRDHRGRPLRFGPPADRVIRVGEEVGHHAVPRLARLAYGTALCSAGARPEQRHTPERIAHDLRWRALTLSDAQRAMLQAQIAFETSRTVVFAAEPTLAPFINP